MNESDGHTNTKHTTDPRRHTSVSDTSAHIWPRPSLSSGLHALALSVYSLNGAKTHTELCPPKPKELEIPAVICS